MSAEFQILRPSETPTLAHRAVVNSHERCRWCGKLKEVAIRYDAEQRPYESHECLSCSPYVTDPEDREVCIGLDLTPIPFPDEDEAVA